MSQQLHATDSRRWKTSVRTHDWLKKIGARFFNQSKIVPMRNLPYLIKASSATPSGHFVKHFFKIVFVASQLDFKGEKKP